MRLGSVDHVFAAESKLSALAIPSNGLHGVVVHPPYTQSLLNATAEPGTFVGCGMSCFCVQVLDAMS